MFFKSGPWYIGDKVQDIDLFIAGIKVPDYVKRLPRGFKDFKFWKASELRAFLLFYSLPIFKQYLLPDNYYEHWFLLVASISIFLKDSISEDDINAAEIMLRSFVRDVGLLYGEVCYTYNVHTLLHLPLLVKRWGPLWATSAFAFESFNGFIADHVHGTKHLGKELINNIKISQSVAVLDNIVNCPSLELVRTPHLSINVLLGKRLHLNCLSNEEKLVLNSCNVLGSYVLHRRAKLMDKQIYTTKSYDDNKKRANSFIQFRSCDNERLMYGQALFFVKAGNATLHCLVKTFKVIHVNLLFHQQSRYVLRNLLPVEDSGELIVIPVQCILMKVLKIGTYLGKSPNSYEVNL